MPKHYSFVFVTIKEFLMNPVIKHFIFSFTVGKRYSTKEKGCGKKSESVVASPNYNKGWKIQLTLIK